MTPEKVRDYIHGLRNLSNVRMILHAAKVRQTELLSHSRHTRKAEIFDKFSWIKKGDTLYIGNKKAALESKWWKTAWAKQLRVESVHPRNKEWHISYNVGPVRKVMILTPAMAQMLKVSRDSNPEALEDVLFGREVPFAVGAQFRLRKMKDGGDYGCGHSLGKVVTVKAAPNVDYREVSRPGSTGSLMVPLEMLEPL